jgi:hypothetical protein
MADRLADRGVLRVRLARGHQEVRRRVAELAPRTAVASDEIVVPGPAHLRPAVLDAIRAAGGTILSIRTEEGRLDGLYRDLVGGA